MAVLLFNPVSPASLGVGTNNTYNATLGAAANSGKITVGNDAIIRIACSGAICVRFGASATITAAGATDMYFPAGVYIWDVGHQNDSLWIYSIAAATIITVSPIQKN